MKKSNSDEFSNEDEKDKAKQAGSQYTFASGVKPAEKSDNDGRLIWRRDARGVISHFSYDPATGALVRKSDDVEMSMVTDPSKPDWITTAGGGRHQVTEYAYDARGRLIRSMMRMLGESPEGERIDKTYA